MAGHPMDLQGIKTHLPTQPEPISIPPASIEKEGDVDIEAQRPIISEKDGPLTSSHSAGLIRQPSPVYLRPNSSSVKKYRRRTRTQARNSKKAVCVRALVLTLVIFAALGLCIIFFLPAILQANHPDSRDTSSVPLSPPWGPFNGSATRT